MSFEREHNHVEHADHQSSGYDNESCSWSNTPDIDFLRDEYPWVLGQFVWTGFDYLGEPSPYDTDAWPSHSSLFGIIDLASLPKDRYWLYRSQWNRQSPTLHVLPHWNWPGREGEVTPVFVYTSYPSAELFVNGRSQGMREKNDSTLQHRYRLMWNETVYEPGELRVVAYDTDGTPAMEKVVRTAGKPHHLVVTANRSTLDADGCDLAYLTVQVADKDGNIVPSDSRTVRFKVSGAATAIVRAADSPGQIIFTVSAPGMGFASATITVI